MSGGCTECRNKGGCDHRKGEMFAAIDDALARLYPTRRWGERDEEAAFGAGISRGEGAALAETLARRLRALALYRPGGDDEPCDYIYVLCVGRPPSIIQIREGAAGPDDVIVGDGVGDETEGGGAGNAGVDELYLRVALSGIARFAAVQEVAMRMVRADDGALEIAETPRTGVFNPILLPRLQTLVAALVEQGIRHVDFGEILEPPAGFDPGDYADRFTGRPAIANYLFYPQPCAAVTTTTIAADALFPVRQRPAS
jgi:hypothetical protein